MFFTPLNLKKNINKYFQLTLEFGETVSAFDLVCRFSAVLSTEDALSLDWARLSPPVSTWSFFNPSFFLPTGVDVPLSTFFFSFTFFFATDFLATPFLSTSGSLLSSSLSPKESSLVAAVLVTVT